MPTFAPLGVREYRRVWTAMVVSNLGTFLQLTAAPWLMNELTGSPLLVSLVTTALTLPRLLLTVPAGVLTDAVDRRTLLIAGQVVSATAVAVMAVTTMLDVITPTALLALSFALGVGNAFALPAAQTLVPDLVPAGLRAQAITLNSAAFNIARAVGPAIGGALVAAGLTAGAFGLNAASYLGIVGVMLTFPRQAVEDPARQRMWRSAALGMRYVRFTRPIRVLLAITAVFALTTAAVQALLPNVASDDLGLGAGGFGLLYGVFGAGALTAALTRERARTRLGAAMLPASVLTFGVAGVVFGLTPGPVGSGIALAVAGVAWVWTLTTLNASIQILAPRWVRGRVVSLYLLAIGLQPVGAFVGGLVAELTGSGLAVAILSAFTVALGLVTFRLELPVLGELEEPHAPEDWHMRPHASEVAGTPILVATTWVIDRDDIAPFMDVMRELRRQRYRTGAHRWSLFRDADQPTRITELFEVHDWAEHLAQHQRMDEEAAAVLARARAFDRDDGPVTRHLAGLDIVDPHADPIETQLLTVHEELHRTDGSVPLAPERATGR
ncbi:MAG: MFS transporter [Actinobacteria bacterium]|nr:MFS transporter [Actinomycetota bacterium]